jgi:hypothetical protein
LQYDWLLQPLYGSLFRKLPVTFQNQVEAAQKQFEDAVEEGETFLEPTLPSIAGRFIHVSLWLSELR